jgi:hypothetical protein
MRPVASSIGPLTVYQTVPTPAAKARPAKYLQTPKVVPKE